MEKGKKWKRSGKGKQRWERLPGAGAGISQWFGYWGRRKKHTHVVRWIPHVWEQGTQVGWGPTPSYRREAMLWPVKQFPTEALRWRYRARAVCRKRGLKVGGQDGRKAVSTQLLVSGNKPKWCAGALFWTLLPRSTWRTRMLTWPHLNEVFAFTGQGSTECEDPKDLSPTFNFWWLQTW